MAEKTDEACVQQAYEEELTQHVKDFVGNCIDETPESDVKFLAGLKIIRAARDKALQMVATKQ